MQLLDLPPEILEIIASKLDSQGSLSAFIQTNRYLYQSFHLYLYSNQILLDRAHKVLQYNAQKQWDSPLVYRKVGEYLLAAAVWLRENPDRRFVDPVYTRPLKKFDPNATQNWPPLAWAAAKGNEQAIRLLLRLKKKGLGMIVPIDVNARDPAYRTPLSYAAEQGHVKIVRLLLQAGADPNAQDVHFARTALHWATSPRLTGRAPTGPFQIQFAASRCPPSFCSVETYFKEDVPGFGAWNDQQEKESDFAYDIENLQFSASLRSLPSPWADKETYEQIVNILVAHGANLETQDSERRTPLCWASACGFTEFVEVLLSKGAQITHPEFPGLRDPVSWAAEHGHTGTIKLLIQAGANATTSPLGHENCSLTLAAMNGHDETLELLVNHFYFRELFGTMNIYNWPLVWAARNGHTSTVKFLLDLCARYYPGRPLQLTSLFWASYHGHTEVLRMLLGVGLSPDIISKWDKLTPLQVAVMNRHVSTVKLLLEYGGSNVNAVDAHGWSAFNWVTKDREMAHVYPWGQSALLEIPRVRRVYAEDVENYRKLRRLVFEHGADQSCQTIKQLLLDHGADPTFKKPKAKATNPPHSILKIHRPREFFPSRVIPVCIQ
ncbi:ankyrin [Penicillium capsulatum]|uniref:Ankyrin n=1 Tax=Penicillium capsulatum TaxID=69766 RepID=A0A9W9M0B5_9EURO|nr:ankyrin [Penicillium capsulatum]KAJ6129496.1 ankyrin [Penicillium capsulatum]